MRLVNKKHILQSKTHEKIFCLINILLPLLMGAYIYIKINKNSHFGNWICSLFSISKIEYSEGIWSALRNWGGDFLWAYALFFALYLALNGMNNARKHSFILSIICSTTMELSQLIQIGFLKGGTFDIWDIVVEMSAVCLGAILLYYNKGEKHK